MGNRRRFVTLLMALITVVSLLVALAPTVLATLAISVKNVAAGETWVVPETTRVRTLTVAPGGAVTAPEGYSLTLTVKGVETGQALATTAGVDMAVVPGTYTNVMLTVAEENLVPYVAAGPGGATHLFPFRQAVYADTDGYGPAKSVPDAVKGGLVNNVAAKNVKITSTGENFTGIYVGGGEYSISKPTINLDRKSVV
jgi:hypothetical protein